MSLRGKVVLVTGGTGHIGRAICAEAHARGAKVLFSYHRGSDRAKALEAELEGAEGFPMDLRSVPDIQQAIESVYSRHPVIHALVNNAGISQAMPLAMLEEEDVDLAMDVNLKGTLFVTRAVVRGMIRARGGSIVSLGSIAGHRVLEVPVTYAMTKAALAGMTTALAAELKRFSIRVNNVVPGMIDGGVAQGIPEDHRRDFLAHCAAGRPGTGRDVANLVCFLCSDDSSYVNAQSLQIDGGV